MSKLKKQSKLKEDIPAQSNDVKADVAQDKKELKPKIFILLLTLMGVVSFLLFKGSIVLMQDDADYIIAPHNFIFNGEFPSVHETYLYHFILSIPILISGTSIFFIKILSFVFALGAFTLTYYTFKKETTRFVLFSVLFMYATSFAILFYSSSVMSEAFFMFIQMLFIYFVYRNHEKLMTNFQFTGKQLISYVKGVIVIVLLSFLVSISKGIGLIAIMSVLFYLLLNGKWKNILIVGGLFGIFKLSFDLVIKSIFNIESLSNRSSTLWLKDYYKPELGNEDFLGLLTRVWENLNYHISCDLMRILGFRDNIKLTPQPVITIIFILLFLFCLILVFKNRKKIFFIGLYVSMMLGGTFLALQAQWKQDRMIIVFIPLIIVFIFESLRHWLSKKNIIHQKMLLFFIFILCLVNLRHLPSKVEENSEERRDYFAGNDFAGYTQDWQNYLAATTWASENLPEGSMVVCRKPNSSKAYSMNGNVTFVGRHRSTKSKADEVLKEFKDQGITHVLLGKIRMDPTKMIPNKFIGTIHTYVRAIQLQYPNKIKILKKFGVTEEAYVLEIVY